MAEPKRYKEQVVVLKRVNYGEYDRIITFLSQHHGKISAMVKSVRKPKSRLAGGIELFSLSEVVILEGKGELDHVISSRLNKHFKNLLSSYERMEVGYKAIELTDRHTEEDAGEDYFNLLVTALENLDDLGVDEQIVLCWFELNLLRLLGRQPDLENDDEDKPLDESKRYSFDPDEGTFAVNPQGEIIASEHIKTWRLLLGRAPVQLKGVKGIDQASSDTVHLLEYMLA